MKKTLFLFISAILLLAIVIGNVVAIKNPQKSTSGTDKTQQAKIVSLTSLSFNSSNYAFTKINQTQQVKVTATYSNQTKKDVTNSAKYSVSNKLVASISSAGLIKSKSNGITTLTASLNGVIATTTIKVNTTAPPIKTLVSLNIAPSSLDLTTNQSKPLVVQANYSDQSVVNVTSQSVFSSSNLNVATVNTSGVVTTTNAGSATISASFGGLTQSILVNVSAPIGQVNVKNFGAVGNGTTDDTAAFQSAIDYLGSRGGGTVFVPAGTYSLNPIFLKPFVNIVGDNRDTVTLKLSNTSGSGYYRVITMANDTKIQNITCDGNAIKHPDGIEHMHCIFAYDADRIVIDNNRLINAVGDGVSISGSTLASNDVTISNNILENNGRSNIVVEQANHLKIFNNISTSTIGRPALHFEPWEEMNFDDAKIYNNTFTSNATDGAYCIQLEGGKNDNNYFNHVEFYNNTVTCTTGGFLVMETNGAKIHDNNINVEQFFIWIKNKELEIYNNKIHTEEGFRVEGTWGINSVNTQVYDNVISTNQNAVTIVAGSEGTKFTRNNFTGNGTGAAVYTFASVTDIKNTSFIDNTFTNFDTGIVTDYNIYDVLKVDGLTVQGNTFKNISSYGVNIKGTTKNVTVDHNTFNGVSGVSIIVQDGPMTNINITNNSISSGKNGFYQTASGKKGSLSGLIISGNLISYTTDKGDAWHTGAAIELDQNTTPPTNVSIINNTLTGNAVNKITVPKVLLPSVQNNIFN
ncbi:right-handed parallel beta-helix repeat-containing protein [Gottfriedia acidiceleris]|uniref:right-handed parallel beta-helix repeat-containing protein n=1 Tax=Gottfriedia acidiceleris TaxID=371036 RepID=UPI0014303BFF|nr:right-handed parallel beta-helix repeat-containing protein [Gottfriedia acidiceleris]